MHTLVDSTVQSDDDSMSVTEVLSEYSESSTQRGTPWSKIYSLLAQVVHENTF